ncbi:MAG: hypothetical protein HY327_12815 [Chloroflexi bacterium]|nr:hypothetical protein [Chloroflexota bacterium]
MNSAIAERIGIAPRSSRRSRSESFAALNAIFRAGKTPRPALDGRYRGELIALDVAPGLSEFTEFISARWMPWQGKTFDAAHSSGDNIFTRDSLALAHIYWPLYRGYVDDGAATYRAFAFQTRIAPGLTDPDRPVLKIDYDLPANPAFTIRRVLDELVELESGLYLGKAHLKWWWDKWQTVAYFSLERGGGM